MSEDLTQAETHFAFGKNWATYAEKITAAEIAEAEKGLRKLLGERLDGLRFLDVGCGSGLHALAALRLGAREVVAVDIDADSVATTLAVLSRWSPAANFRVERQSVFELAPENVGTFDVVYSWGVLHHTGDLRRALRQAAALVGEGGRFALRSIGASGWIGFGGERNAGMPMPRPMHRLGRAPSTGCCSGCGLPLRVAVSRTMSPSTAASGAWISSTTRTIGSAAGRMSPSARGRLKKRCVRWASLPSGSLPARVGFSGATPAFSVQVATSMSICAREPCAA